MAVDHEAKHVWDVVERLQRTIHLPHAIHVGISSFDARPNPGNKPGVCCGDLDIGTFGITLVAEYVLAHNQLHAVYSIHAVNFGLKMAFERLAMLGCESNGGGNVEVVVKIGNVKQNRVAITSDSKQFDRSLSTDDSSLLGLDGLEHEVGLPGVKVAKWRPGPTLVSFRIIMLEIRNVLAQLLKDFRFERAFWLG